MTLTEARLLREVKKGCTYRRLAEIFYPADHPGHGNQGYGEDLCKEALEVLYPGKNLWQTGGREESATFALDNTSRFGAFYWWE
jgi:hypothetical protein